MHSVVLPESAIGHPWDKDAPPLDAGGRWWRAQQEAFLSFLGLGVPPPMASWGTLIADGVRRMETAPWILIVSAGSLAIWLVCLHAAGDRLARRLNVARTTGIPDPALTSVDPRDLEANLVKQESA